MRATSFRKASRRSRCRQRCSPTAGSAPRATISSRSFRIARASPKIGTYRGQFARHILGTCEPAELHLIDIDFSLLDPDVAADPRVVLHRGLSHTMLGQFADGTFDWIYVDGDHSYEGASRDAAVASTKVKPGGYLAFNDFAHMDPYLGAYGVHRAVTEFAVRERWKFVWWAYEPHGLYDVALRRPMET